MIYENEVKNNKELNENLKVDCEKCFGFCCVALYFSKSEGFPNDKEAGKPCINLQSDFKCAVHKNLRQKGLKGCTAYDCFGAGQKVAQVTYKGQDWRESSKIAEQMFDVFLVMRQLHEMLWYLANAYKVNNINKDEIMSMINETVSLTNLDGSKLMKVDLVAHRHNVNALLSKTSELVRSENTRGKKNGLKSKKMIAGRRNLIGADLKKIDLRGADLRGALLIAADLRGADLSGTDLIGSDLRDTDLRGANLKNSIFITQPQINAAKGDLNTKLPISLTHPTYWEK